MLFYDNITTGIVGFFLPPVNMVSVVSAQVGDRLKACGCMKKVDCPIFCLMY